MSQNLRPQNERRTLTHAGAEVGADNVERSQNVVDQNTPILSWTGPRKFSQIEFAAGAHATKANLRSLETFADTDLTNGDTATLATNIVPVNGEEEIAEQPFPVVVAVVVDDTDVGTEVDVTSINYSTNEVTVDATVTSTDTLKLYPLISDGTIRYQGHDQFDHRLGSLDEWGTPLHVFCDHDQRKADSTIHLVGRATWREEERLSVYIDAPVQVCWEDDHYPDRYVSTYQQRVDISV